MRHCREKLKPVFTGCFVPLDLINDHWDHEGRSPQLLWVNRRTHFVIGFSSLFDIESDLPKWPPAVTLHTNPFFGRTTCSDQGNHRLQLFYPQDSKWIMTGIVLDLNWSSIWRGLSRGHEWSGANHLSPLSLYHSLCIVCILCCFLYIFPFSFVLHAVLYSQNCTNKTDFCIISCCISFGWIGL